MIVAALRRAPTARTMMKPDRPLRNPLPVRRIHAILLCLLALLLCNALAGFLLWRRLISADLAWAVELLTAGALAVGLGALWVSSRKALVEPIRGIAEWASRIRQGDFSARLAAGQAELYGLTDDINRLAEWLESLAELKNRELIEQAARLKTQTHLVRLLYDISGDFGHNAGHAELLRRTAGPMAAALESRRIEFHRFDSGGDGDGESTLLAAHGGTPTDDAQYVAIPLRFGATANGECRIWFAAARFPLADELSQLLYALGRNIGMAIERSDLQAESARLSRMRERAHLANELHDSLAQTIAGLGLQVRVLDDLLHQQEEQAVWEQMEKVENLLVEANAELRSLIAYFRVPLDPGGWRPALQSLVDRFRRETECALFFQDQWGEVDLPEKWQLDIVRIIQEALANIRKHSEAKNARVLLRRDEAGGYTALVEDDGVGIGVDADNADTAPGAHIGRAVMAQRARAFGAELQVESEPGEGARILLSFTRPPPP